MGSGTWKSAVYTASTGDRITRGETFSYTAVAAAAAPEDREASEFLSPKRVNENGNYKDKNVRESLDTDEHPTVTSIAVGLDVTGSNIDDARVVQEKLPQLLGVIQRKGLIEHPQISIGAMGDAYYDSVPLQFAPFESDNRIDDHLDNIYLEGGGGGNHGESYGLYLYFLARHTHLDSWEKRGKKGYAFLIADENCLVLEPSDIRKFIGDTDVETKLTAEQLFRMAEEHYEVYVLVPRNGAARIQNSLEFYRNIIGQRTIDLDNSANIAEVIASIVRAMEGDDLDDIDSDLKSLGVDAGARSSVSTALANVGATGGAVAVSETPADLEEDSEETERV